MFSDEQIKKDAANSSKDRSMSKDRSISAWTAQAVVLLLTGPVLFACVAPYLLIWGGGALDGALDGIHSGALIGIFIGGIVLHEILHGIGWALAGEKRWKEISFGFQLKSLTPYATVDGRMEAWAYRIGGALPGAVLGLAPWAISLFVGHAGLHLFGVVFTVVAGGDAVVLWLLLDVPNTVHVQDHPERMGCILVEPDTAQQQDTALQQGPAHELQDGGA
jgi:hypothetical protein